MILPSVVVEGLRFDGLYKNLIIVSLRILQNEDLDFPRGQKHWSLVFGHCP